MDDVKINSENIQISKNFPGRRDIHSRCGFRIAHYQRSVTRAPLEEKDMAPRYFEYYSLCHLTDGKGWYWTPEGGREYLSAGQGIFISPRFVHKYGGFHSHFTEDYICFDGPVADYMYRAGVLSDGIVQIGVVRRLIPIHKLALNLSDRGQLAANSALQGLLYDLYLKNSHDPLPGVDMIDRLLEKLSSQADQWWTVGDMADYCNLSENQFRRRFKARIGMGPKHYYDSLKMQLAAGKLLRTGTTLVDIARELGYMDSYHLSKVFKRIHNLSPESYREKYRF